MFDEHGFYDLGRSRKLNYAQVFVPFKKIGEGGRENVLKSIAYQLVALNKDINRSVLLKYLNSINDGKMSPPLHSS